MEELKLLDYKDRWGGHNNVYLEINNYLDNNNMFIHLMAREDGFDEPYGNVTVNLGIKVPDYCAYVDLNNMPELEGFIEENGLGEFTGIVQRSGFCEYPLYMFNVDKLRELCPDGMDVYEANIGVARQPEKKDLVR